MSGKKLTPMQIQYNKIKSENEDSILFYRLGDFYEMFGSDAIKASKILGIVLTRRNKGAQSQTPMCGVPYHSADSYINKLTKIGYKVAICEQVSDPTLKGIVDRKVVRVVTPGTTMSEGLLDKKKNNFLLAFSLSGVNYSISYVDLSTGDFLITETKSINKIIDELYRLEPTEVIVNSSHIETFKGIYKNDVFIYEYNVALNFKEILQDHYLVRDLSCFGIEKKQDCLKVAGYLLNYLLETQLTSINHLKKPKFYNLDDFMHIDASTINNLEILKCNSGQKNGSLLNAIDKTITPMGSRFLRDAITKPLLNIKDIENRHNSVEEFIKKKDDLLKLRELLDNINDMERTISRIGLNRCNSKDLLSVKNSLFAIDDIKKVLSIFDSTYIKSLNRNLNPIKSLSALLEKAILDEPKNEILDGGMIKESYNKELKEYIEATKHGKDLIASMQVKEQKNTGIDTLKIRYNRVFGYYIEVSKAKAKGMPDRFERKQTLVNAERFSTKELKELEEKILHADEKSKTLEYEIFCELKVEVTKKIQTIQNNALIISKIDMLQSFAFQAIKKNYTKPIFVKENILDIEQGRHPVLELISDLGKFIPNNTYLDSNKKYVQLLTGPNMSGKSTYLRQISLIVLMAQIGSFVPAKSLTMSIFDCIFTRVGASDSLTRGQSTFMVEMQEASYILNNATKHSLIILDEIGRGTSTYDGLSIAWSIMEYIHDHIKAKTIFATHYHELIEVCEQLSHSENISVVVKEKEGRVIFLYKIAKGGIDQSYGIEVGKIAGLPKQVILRAKKLLKRLEQDPYRRKLGNISISQGNLFEVEGNSDEADYDKGILEEIKKLDLDMITPLESLQKLNDIKKRI